MGLVTCCKSIKHRLFNADVGLYPADNQLFALEKGKPIGKCGLAETTERQFLNWFQIPQFRADLADGLPESPGILLCPDNGKFEDLCEFNEFDA